MKPLILLILIVVVVAVGAQVQSPAAADDSQWVYAHLPSPHCFVVGEVFWAKEEMEPQARLTTACPIHVVRDGKYIKMSSSKWMVEIAIPEDPRPQGFLYVWGQPVATIGNRPMKVAYGPVDGL